MSGGHFEYKQYMICDISCAIQEEIKKHKDVDTVFEYDNRYSDETIKYLEDAVEILNIASIYAQRVDWLLSGDDDEDNFKLRLNNELKDLKNV